jgi:thiosulfate dehydrogenase (quinone) large subunit
MRTRSGAGGPRGRMTQGLAQDRMARGGIAFVRITVGLLWLTQVVWKTPPDFKTLAHFTSYAVDHPVFAPWSSVVDKVILPNITVFGWITIVTEASIAAFLLLGLATRFWALVGLVMTTTIILSSINGPNEWSWTYYMMFALHVTILATAAGRSVGLDGILRPAWQASRGRLARFLVVSS